RHARLKTSAQDMATARTAATQEHSRAGLSGLPLRSVGRGAKGSRSRITGEWLEDEHAVGFPRKRAENRWTAWQDPKCDVALGVGRAPPLPRLFVTPLCHD